MITNSPLSTLEKRELHIPSNVQSQIQAGILAGDELLYYEAISSSQDLDDLEFVVDYNQIVLEASGVGTVGLAVSPSTIVGRGATGDLAALTPTDLLAILPAELKVRVTSQFDKTNDAALANITGLSVSLVAGKSYHFRVILFIDADVTGGHKYAVSGGCTATTIIYQVNSVSNTTNLNVINSRQVALDGAIGQAGLTSGFTIIEGLITVANAGTLTIQFAQNAATPATTSSVLVGSNLVVEEIT